MMKEKETAAGRDALLKQITVLDFMAVDLNLYLNTHPDDAEALKMYNDTIESRGKAVAGYEELYGPLTSYRSKGGTGWTWEECPWPWQEPYNYAGCGERC